MTGKIMELDLSDGLLKVKFSDRLISLLKEVRTLLEYGFKIPDHVKKIAIEGKKFIKEGTALKKVANFFNSMSS
jgi:dynein heavy chain 2